MIGKNPRFFRFSYGVLRPILHLTATSITRGFHSLLLRDDPRGRIYMVDVSAAIQLCASTVLFRLPDRRLWHSVNPFSGRAWFLTLIRVSAQGRGEHKQALQRHNSAVGLSGRLPETPPSSEPRRGNNMASIALSLSRRDQSQKPQGPLFLWGAIPV